MGRKEREREIWELDKKRKGMGMERKRVNECA